MGIRETLNKNPSITTGVTAAIVLVAIGTIVWQLWDGNGGGGVAAAKQFYTDDDGATYYADDIKNVAPYDHHGKTAVQAMVYQCGESKPFVAMLQRYTADAKVKMEKAMRDSARAVDLLEEAESGGIEVKKPLTGTAGWMKNTDPRAMLITRVTCPNGKTDGLRMVPAN